MRSIPDQVLDSAIHEAALPRQHWPWERRTRRSSSAKSIEVKVKQTFDENGWLHNLEDTVVVSDYVYVFICLYVTDLI